MRINDFHSILELVKQGKLFQETEMSTRSIFGDLIRKLIGIS